MYLFTFYSSHYPRAPWSSPKSALFWLTTVDLRFDDPVAPGGRITRVGGKKKVAQPRDKGGEEVHGQEQGHHELDRHGHEEGGEDDGDGGTGGHRLADSGQVGRF